MRIEAKQKIDANKNQKDGSKLGGEHWISESLEDLGRTLISFFLLLLFGAFKVRNAYVFKGSFYINRFLSYLT
jgi:hypothetical protein